MPAGQTDPDRPGQEAFGLELASALGPEPELGYDHAAAEA
jgi:hypothetical protein